MLQNHAKAAFCRMHSYYGDDEYYELGSSVPELGVGINSLYKENFIPNGAVVLSKEVFYNPGVGLYDPHVSMAGLCD